MTIAICEQLCHLSFVDNHSGWMAIFDEDKAKPWAEKLFTRDVEFNGKTLHLIGL